MNPRTLVQTTTVGLTAVAVYFGGGCGFNGSLNPDEGRYACENNGGSWEKINTGGPTCLRIEDGCVFPTTDTGRVCTTGRDCEGYCVSDRSVNEFSCSPRTVIEGIVDFIDDEGSINSYNPDTICERE